MRATTLTLLVAGAIGATSVASAPISTLTLVAMVATATAAMAHGDGDHDKTPKPFDPRRIEDTPYGRAADPKTATRTLRISMNDQMRFTPAVISVRQGETLRLVVRNEGKVLHELVLGTPAELSKHAALMRKFPDMEHDEPNMVHVKPGLSGEIAWTFDKPGEFAFACLVAGHFEAGMVGKVVVK